MNWLDRRLTPRTDWIADIHFEPDNGGIVLNLSEGGLGFHAIDPLQIDSTIHFYVSLYNQRIHAAGQLAWIDQTKRTGGLRFTGLSAVARQQILNWIKQPATPRFADDASPHRVPPLGAFLAATFIQPEKKADLLAVTLPRRKRLAPWRGFPAGLTVGILVSALVTATVSLYSYRRQFGERAAKPQVQDQAASPVAKPMSPEAAAPSSPSALIAFSQRDALPPRASSEAPVAQQAESEPVMPGTARLIVVGDSRPKAPTTTGSAPISSTPPPPSLPNISVASGSYYLVPSKLGPTPPLAPTSQPNVLSVASGTADVGTPSEMYFEVGKFKEHQPAGVVTEKLAQFGFHAMVTQKSRFWGSSYYVLVGPYDNDREAKNARKGLASRGFKPRAFERGSRAFAFYSTLTLNAARIPAGDCSIRWESYSNLVDVQFVQKNDIVATVEGKWAIRNVPYYQSAYAFTTNSDGSRNLMEIRFAGMTRALVF